MAIRCLPDFRVWIDGEEYENTHAEIRSELIIGVGMMSAGKLIVPLSDAAKIYRQGADRKPVDVAILQGSVVTIACNLAIVEQGQDTQEGPFAQIRLSHGEPLEIVSADEWLESVNKKALANTSDGV